jgi:hypothetical protein
VHPAHPHRPSAPTRSFADRATRDLVYALLLDPARTAACARNHLATPTLAQVHRTLANIMIMMPFLHSMMMVSTQISCLGVRNARSHESAVVFSCRRWRNVAGERVLLSVFILASLLSFTVIFCHSVHFFAPVSFSLFSFSLIHILIYFYLSLSFSGTAHRRLVRGPRLQL